MMTMSTPIWPIGSLYNPHRISSSFNNSTKANQTYDPRPHVNISLINTIFLALVDTGASVCLIDGTIIDSLIQQGHKFNSSKSTANLVGIPLSQFNVNRGCSLVILSRYLSVKSSP